MHRTVLCKHVLSLLTLQVLKIRR